MQALQKEYSENDLFPPTDITEDRIREIALPLGLVDVKVCAIDETWSGLKFVVRLKDRKK